jgi:glycosyltransferase involved in cell wall biosynthesis
MPEYELHLIVKEHLSRDRLEQGWELPPVIGMKLHTSPGYKDALEIVSEAGNIHIFEGIGGNLWGSYIRPAKRHHNMVMVVTESPDLRGIKGTLRYILSYFYEKQRLKDVDYLLYIGDNARKWYLFCDLPTDRLIPFIYTVRSLYDKDSCDESIHKLTDRRSPGPHHAQSASPHFKLVFIGSLIKLKAVDLLLRALHLTHLSFSLDIIGVGPEQEYLEALVKDMQLSAQVIFKGSMPNSALRNDLEEYDLLVLPSHYDGWGCVVNEALMVGTPVLCSSNCGAADLFTENSCLGSVFESGNLRSLVSSIGHLIRKGKTTPEQRTFIRMWANSINSMTVASYLARFLLNCNQRDCNVSVKAPWKLPAGCPE